VEFHLGFSHGDSITAVPTRSKGPPDLGLCQLMFARERCRRSGSAVNAFVDFANGFSPEMSGTGAELYVVTVGREERIIRRSDQPRRFDSADSYALDHNHRVGRLSWGAPYLTPRNTPSVTRCDKAVANGSAMLAMTAVLRILSVDQARRPRP